MFLRRLSGVRRWRLAVTRPKKEDRKVSSVSPHWLSFNDQHKTLSDERSSFLLKLSRS